MQILHLLQELQMRLHMSMILITHDISVVATTCHRVLVMYAGKIVEEGTVQEVLKTPRHPYTRALLASRPSLRSVRGEKLTTIEGSPPSLVLPPKGCPFAARCPHAMNICVKQFPPTLNRSACWLEDPRCR